MEWKKNLRWILHLEKKKKSDQLKDQEYFSNVIQNTMYDLNIRPNLKPNSSMFSSHMLLAMLLIKWLAS